MADVLDGRNARLSRRISELRRVLGVGADAVGSGRGRVDGRGCFVRDGWWWHWLVVRFAGSRARGRGRHVVVLRWLLVNWGGRGVGVADWFGWTCAILSDAVAVGVEMLYGLLRWCVPSYWRWSHGRFDWFIRRRLRR